MRSSIRGTSFYLIDGKVIFLSEKKFRVALLQTRGMSDINVDWSSGNISHVVAVLRTQRFALRSPDDEIFINCAFSLKRIVIQILEVITRSNKLLVS